MTRNHPDIETLCLRGSDKGCGRRMHGKGGRHPLSRTCCRQRLRVCKIGGDRKICARLANLGLLPGNEMEVLCPAQGNRLVVKVNGGTISIDNDLAEHIMVTPA
jgi:Fe2+ transport system protein FeoA